MRLVARRSPVPQEFWLFHTRSLGGLWVALPDAAQICRGQRSEFKREIPNLQKKKA